MLRAFPRSITPPSEVRPDQDPRTEWPLDPDDFAAYYRYCPSALALRECLRLRAVRKHQLQAPILDIGCGDGLFATLAYPGKQAWGIDINVSEIRRAQSSAVYETLVCGSITDVAFPEGFFKGAIANCSLEHVPDLDRALSNIRRALAPGSEFINIVPTPNWTRLLAIPELLRSHGLVGLADAYGRTIDKVFNHIHLYDESEWTRRLAQAGFAVRSIETLTSRRSTWVFDYLMYPSLVGWLTKRVTGKWVLAPGLRNLTVDMARGLINRLAASIDDGDDGGEFLIVAEATSARTKAR